jgi:ATP-dependent Clp protease ATP-binding subunit ClpA
MFERFTAAARDAVAGAQEESRALHAARIGTEHLLIALAAAPGGPARAALDATGVGAGELRRAVGELAAAGPAGRLDADALASIGIDLDAVRRRVEDTFGPGALDRGVPCRDGRPPFTREAKKVLELALRCAIARGDRHIGPEHVLLGILTSARGGAIDALRRLGVDPERLRDALAVPSA